jgi:hypothetical protein
LIFSSQSSLLITVFVFYIWQIPRECSVPACTLPPPPGYGLDLYPCVLDDMLCT